VTRQQVALRPPPATLDGFPRWRLRRSQTLYRAHHRQQAALWFSSSLHGRFDLPPPDGTCYLALDEVSAFRERLGERLSALGLLSASEADSIMVSRLRVPRELRLADTCHPSAVSFGLTREIATVTPYALPRQWAAAFHTAGMRGVRYESRFSTAARANAVAVFGTDGASDCPAGESRSGRAVAEDAGIRVLPRPRSRSLRVILPPG
jgi:hypothetical protein